MDFCVLLLFFVVQHQSQPYLFFFPDVEKGGKSLSSFITLLLLRTQYYFLITKVLSKFAPSCGTLSPKAISPTSKAPPQFRKMVCFGLVVFCQMQSLPEKHFSFLTRGKHRLKIYNFYPFFLSSRNLLLIQVYEISFIWILLHATIPTGTIFSIFPLR